MATLSKERREWLYTTFPESAAAMIREIESLPTQEQANKMVTRLKDKITADWSRSGLPTSEHPGVHYFGTAFKSVRGAQKDAAETAEAQAVLDLMELADRLELPQGGVMKLVTEYGLTVVTSILQTLSNTKATKGYFVDSFFGTKTTRIDARDVEQLIRQKHASDRDSFFS